MKYIEDLKVLLGSKEIKNIYFLQFLLLLNLFLEMLGLGLIVPIMTLLTNPALIVDNLVVQSLTSCFSLNGPNSVLKALIFLLLFIFTVKGILQFYLLRKQARFSKDLSRNLSLKIFKGYLLQPYKNFLKQNTAQLVKNIENEVSTFSSTVDYFFLFQTNLVLITAIFSMVVYTEPEIGGLILIFFTLFGLAFFLFTKRKIKLWSVRRQFEQASRFQYMFEGLNAYKDIKILKSEAFFIGKFEVHNSSLHDIIRRVLIFQGLPKIYLEVLMVYGILVVFGVVFINGNSVVQVLPTIALIFTASFRVLPAFSGLMAYFQGIKYGLPSISTLASEIRHSSKFEQYNGGIDGIFDFRKEIVLKNVQFRYEGVEQEVISNVDLQIKRGEFIGIIGKSGSGKSTLVDILLGLLQPTSGVALVDDRDTYSSPLYLAKNLGYVPQVINLIDDSIGNNIAFGVRNECIDYVALREAILSAQLDEFVDSLPDGVNTRVGEKGVRLSGGQRQRIGIARALYHKPELLILDEATSSLDTVTEEGVMHSVNLLSESITIIVIAHRLTTVSKCDRIYKMEKGKIVSHGTPLILLNKDLG